MSPIFSFASAIVTKLDTLISTTVLVINLVGDWHLVLLLTGVLGWLYNLFLCYSKIQEAVKIIQAIGSVIMTDTRILKSNNLHSNAHCCSFRIVLNQTFHAGRLSVPMFIVVYGLGIDDLYYDDIVT